MNLIDDNGKILEACYQAHKDWNIVIPKSKTDIEFVLETIAGMHNLLADREGTSDHNVELIRKNNDLTYDLGQAMQTRDYYKAECEKYRVRLRALSDKVQRYCNKLVDQAFTHGQKNGAILMLAALVRGEGMDDTGTNDIPF